MKTAFHYIYSKHTFYFGKKIHFPLKSYYSSIFIFEKSNFILFIIPSFYIQLKRYLMFITLSFTIIYPDEDNVSVQIQVGFAKSPSQRASSVGSMLINNYTMKCCLLCITIVVDCIMTTFHLPSIAQFEVSVKTWHHHHHHLWYFFYLCLFDDFSGHWSIILATFFSGSTSRHYF